MPCSDNWQAVPLPTPTFDYDRGLHRSSGPRRHVHAARNAARRRSHLGPGRIPQPSSTSLPCSLPRIPLPCNGCAVRYVSAQRGGRSNPGGQRSGVLICRGWQQGAARRWGRGRQVRRGGARREATAGASTTTGGCGRVGLLVSSFGASSRVRRGRRRTCRRRRRTCRRRTKKQRGRGTGGLRRSSALLLALFARALI